MFSVKKVLHIRPITVACFLSWKNLVQAPLKSILKTNDIIAKNWMCSRNIVIQQTPCWLLLKKSFPFLFLWLVSCFKVEVLCNNISCLFRGLCVWELWLVVVTYCLQIYLLMKQDSFVRFLKSDVYKTALIGEMEGRPLPYASLPASLSKIKAAGRKVSKVDVLSAAAAAWCNCCLLNFCCQKLWLFVISFAGFLSVVSRCSNCY